MADLPIIVLGNGITALGTIRILGRDGLTAWVADPTDSLLQDSRWFRSIPDAPAPLQPGGLSAWLENLPFPSAVLMPCSDHWVSEVAKLSPAIRQRFPASLGTAESIERLVDKGRFAQTLRETKTPHPWTTNVDTDADLAAVPKAIFGSAILKPRNSQCFHERFGVKALHVTSREDAAVQLRRLMAAGFPVILQEYIPGPATHHYFVDGFVDRHGVVRAVFVRQRLRMSPADFGNSSSMASVPTDRAREAIEAITAVLKHIAYRGIFSAEFKVDARDGNFKILEVNARPWWFIDFAARCGVDVCRMAYDDALERSVETVDQYKVGRALVFPYTDYFACVTMRARGELSAWEWMRSWLTSQQPVFQFSDPLPAVRATVKILVQFVGNRLRRLWPAT
jgi:D-aspartate ligase